jgi:hypothetical protein
MGRALRTLVRISAAAAALSAGTLIATAGEGENVPLTPGKGLPLDIGNKHAVTYYTEKDGACSVTVVLSSKEGGVTGDDSPGTRVTALVVPGSRLQIDSSTAQSAEFFCGPGGRKMNARVFEREGYSKDKKS